MEEKTKGVTEDVEETETEEKTEDVTEEKAEDVEETKTEDAAEGLPAIVHKLREEYEKRIAELEAKHAADIADRDAIIQQLISGNPPSNVSRETFIDKINDKRNFKKW